jgi:hypothetical protein
MVCTPMILMSGRNCNQTAAADRHEDCVDRAGMLAQDFHCNRTLAGDHFGIVERMDKGQLLLFFKLQGVVVGIGIGLAVQHHFHALAAAAPHGFDFQQRRGGGHDDECPAAKLGRRQGNALRMVAGRGANDAALQLRVAQIRHLVVSAAHLEAKDVLHVLALEVNLVANSLRENRRQFERGFMGHVVDAGGQDFLQVVDSHSLQRKRCGAKTDNGG